MQRMNSTELLKRCTQPVRCKWLPPEITRADEVVLRHICMLMKDNYTAVGFLPEGAIRQALAFGQIYHQYENDEWVGYLLRGPIRPYQRVHIRQECIDKDARNLGSGRKCFERLLLDAIRGDASSIRLRCAEDLPSNLFWQAMGFEAIAIDITPNTRDRRVIVYQLELKPTLFTVGRDGKPIPVATMRECPQRRSAEGR